MFEIGVSKKHIAENPMASLQPNFREGKAALREYICPNRIEAIFSVMPGPWKLMTALARFGGLRSPSKSLLQRWSEVHLEAKCPYLHVKSPETESQGKSWREVPISPRLAEILQEGMPADALPAGFVVDLPSYRKPRKGGWHGVNTRQQFNKILVRAGIGLIKNAFKVFRSLCVTDWARDHAVHVVAAWAGHTVAVAAKHYLTLIDHDWIKATTSTTTTPMPSNSTTGVVLAKSGEALTSTLAVTPAVNRGKLSVQNETKKIKSMSGESTLTVSQSVSHSGEEMGVLEENLTKTLNTDVVSRTELTASEPICPDIRIYPARIRT